MAASSAVPSWMTALPTDRSPAQAQSCPADLPKAEHGGQIGHGQPGSGHVVGTPSSHHAILPQFRSGCRCHDRPRSRTSRRRRVESPGPDVKARGAHQLRGARAYAAQASPSSDDRELKRVNGKIQGHPRRQPAAPRDGVRRRGHVERRPKIDDRYVFSGVEPLLERACCDASRSPFGGELCLRLQRPIKGGYVTLTEPQDGATAAGGRSCCLRSRSRGGLAGGLRESRREPLALRQGPRRPRVRSLSGRCPRAARWARRRST